MTRVVRWLGLACLLALAACAAQVKPDATSYRLVGYVASWEKLLRIDAYDSRNFFAKGPSRCCSDQIRLTAVGNCVV